MLSAGQDASPTTVNIPSHICMLSPPPPLHFRMTYLTTFHLCFLVVDIILFFRRSSGILVANHRSF